MPTLRAASNSTCVPSTLVVIKVIAGQNAAIDMGFGGTMHHGVAFGHSGEDRFPIPDVAPDEPVFRVILAVGEIGRIAGVREQIEVDNVGIRPSTQGLPHEVASDESTSAGYQDVFESLTAVRVRVFVESNVHRRSPTFGVPLFSILVIGAVLSNAVTTGQIKIDAFAGVGPPALKDAVR